MRNIFISFFLLVTVFLAKSQNLDGTVQGSENFDTAVSAPAGNGSSTFNSSVKLSTNADINGIGKGVEFIYDANLFENEEITLVTFSSIPAGDYIIRYSINADVAGFSYEAVISDGSSSQTQTNTVNFNGAFYTQHTLQHTITETKDISLTIQMSPFVSSFTNSTVYVDSIELIKMNDVLETNPIDATIKSTEDFNASTTPNASGSTSFVNNVKLSTDADVAGAGNGLECIYSPYNADKIEAIDVASFETVPAGTYFIRYDFQNSAAKFNYYCQIINGTDTINVSVPLMI